jgi:predicted molibdopterin-dependent oxidoreductase YjgC
VIGHNPTMGRQGRLPLGDALERGPEVSLTLDGRAVTAYLGETVAAVLFADGAADTRTTVGGSPRGVFCGMGVCFDCLVVVDGVPNTRACMTWVRDGMQVSRQDGLVARKPQEAAEAQYLGSTNETNRSSGSRK